MTNLAIVNIIATTRIKDSIDVETLARVLESSRYNPIKFVGLAWKINETATIITFSNGTISSYGAKSEAEARNAIMDALKEFKRKGCVNINSEVEKITIENVVGCADLGYKPRIESLASLPSTIYEPDQFSGLIYRPFKDKRVCLVFSSGKIILVGNKSEQQVFETFEYVKEIISNCT